jgi:hypothetical protein
MTCSGIGGGLVELYPGTLIDVNLTLNGSVEDIETDGLLKTMVDFTAPT